MNIEKERELFEVEFSKIKSDISFWVNTWDEDMQGYNHPVMCWIWHIWLASANRDGYKLVPVKATDSQWAAGIDAYTQAMDGQDILSASAFFDIYEAMIGAIE